MLTVDRPRYSSSRERSAFAKVRNAERQFGVQLRKIARHVGDLIKQFEPGDPAVLPHLEQTLGAYSRVIEPWARATCARLLAEVKQRDEAAWATIAKEMSRSLRREIREAPTGELMRALLEEQVGLIKSLPIEAARRVHELTIELVSGGRRASEIIPEILRSGPVTVSRANTIARTETSRAAGALTQARALHVGSEGYIWLTSRDADVRVSHKKMEGKFVRWDSPPTLDGMTGHAGGFPNCRCVSLPQVPDTFD